MSEDSGTFRVHGVTPVAVEVEKIMDERARHFEERWDKRTKTVNRRLLFLFVVMFVAIGYFAYRGEKTDDRIRSDAYAACQARADQFATYNQSMPTAIAQIVRASNPEMDAAAQTELVAALTLQLQVPPLVCVAPA